MAAKEVKFSVDARDKRNLGKSLPLAENVARRGLTLPLRQDPMLDPQVLAGMGIGPPRDVAGGKDTRHAAAPPPTITTRSGFALEL